MSCLPLVTLRAAAVSSPWKFSIAIFECNSPASIVTKSLGASRVTQLHLVRNVNIHSQIEFSQRPIKLAVISFGFQ